VLYASAGPGLKTKCANQYIPFGKPLFPCVVRNKHLLSVTALRGPMLWGVAEERDYVWLERFGNAWVGDGATSLEIRGLGFRPFSRLWISPKTAKQNSSLRARVEKSERISAVFWREEEPAKEGIIKNQVAEVLRLMPEYFPPPRAARQPRGEPLEPGKGQNHGDSGNCYFPCAACQSKAVRTISTSSDSFGFQSSTSVARSAPATKTAGSPGWRGVSRAGYRSSRHRLHGRNYFLNTVTAASAEVQEHAVTRIQLPQCQYMCARQVSHVDIVANRRPIWRRVVGAKNIDRATPAERSLNNQRNLMGFRKVILPQLVVRISPGGIKVAQCSIGETVCRSITE
jgi:hypothetical protein